MDQPQSPTVEDDAAVAGRRWFIIMTNVRAEATVNDSLKGRGFETLFLHYKETARHARREEPRTRSLYPRYLFVAVSRGQSLETVRWSLGVSTIVENADGPFEVPPAIIADLRARGDADGLCEHPDAKGPEAHLAEGQRVRIVGGLLGGRSAVIEVYGGRVVRVSVETERGGHKRVTLDRKDVTPEP